MSNRPPILDPSGQPIRSEDDKTELNLPPGVQALIETRINSGLDNLRAAFDDLRESNRGDLKDLSREHSRNWRIVALTVTVVLAVLTFIAPSQIKQWIREGIDKRLTEPMLQKSADELLSRKMSDYVTQKLEPLQQKTNDMDKAITGKQKELMDAQAKLSEQLRIQQLGVATKAGSLAAFRELQEMKPHDQQAQDLLSAVLKEIAYFYDADQKQLSYSVSILVETLTDPGFSTDELMFIMVNDPDYNQIGAINSLGNLKAKPAVAELCRRVHETKNLHMAARAIWALREITGEPFHPLDFEHVRKWWAQNGTNQAYCGNYAGYLNVRKAMGTPPISNQDLERFVEELRVTIASDPDALHSCCLQAGFLLMLGRDDEARKLLDDVRTRKNDYFWLYVWDAAAHLKTNDAQTAVQLINKAFEKAPSLNFENAFKYWLIFAPVKDDPRINWPSKKIPVAQGIPHAN